MAERESGKAWASNKGLAVLYVAALVVVSFLLSAVVLPPSAVRSGSSGDFCLWVAIAWPLQLALLHLGYLAIRALYRREPWWQLFIAPITATAMGASRLISLLLWEILKRIES